MREGFFRPAYTFIAGDYNLSLHKGQIAEQQISFAGKEMYSLQKKPTTLTSSLTEDFVSGYTKNPMQDVCSAEFCRS